jgi:hypothetical protein
MRLSPVSMGGLVVLHSMLEQLEGASGAQRAHYRAGGLRRDVVLVSQVLREELEHCVCPAVVADRAGVEECRGRAGVSAVRNINVLREMSANVHIQLQQPRCESATCYSPPSARFPPYVNANNCPPDTPTPQTAACASSAP